MDMHITKSASGVYMENCWTWTADHDIDEEDMAQIEVYSGRGILVESEEDNNWFISTPTEHHSKYQYNMVNTKNVYMHQLQTETPYYQPNLDATSPTHMIAIYTIRSSTLLMVKMRRIQPPWLWDSAFPIQKIFPSTAQPFLLGIEIGLTVSQFS